MWFSYAWKEVCVLVSAYQELSWPLLLLVVCYLDHLNVVDELVSPLPMVLLGEKVVVHQALIALLLRHHSYQHLPCRMTENQGLVGTTFGVSVRRVQVAGSDATWRITFRAGFNLNHVPVYKNSSGSTGPTQSTAATVIQNSTPNFWNYGIYGAATAPPPANSRNSHLNSVSYTHWMVVIQLQVISEIQR